MGVYHLPLAELMLNVAVDWLDGSVNVAVNHFPNLTFGSAGDIFGYFCPFDGYAEVAKVFYYHENSL